MDWKPQTLAQLAQVSGFTMADVAFLAGLEESTVSRLWETPDWLDRIKGRSLQALIGVLPGVAEYVYRHSLISRRARLIEELSDQGLEVNEDILRRLVVDERVPEQYLGNALEAAIHIMRNDATALKTRPFRVGLSGLGVDDHGRETILVTRPLRCWM